MARSIRDAKLDTRSARLRLAQRREPYWTNLSGGLSLGYRKGKTGGSWIARSYNADLGKRSYLALGYADDVVDDAKGVVLGFYDAQVKARGWLAGLSSARKPETGPYSVADAMDNYFAYLEAEGRSAEAIRDARTRDAAFIRTALGGEEAGSLTSERLKKWRDGLAKEKPRLRTPKGKGQKHRNQPPELTEQEAVSTSRARRATANRIWTQLRAALNKAFENGKIASDIEWRRVKPFKGVDAARPGHLSVAEAKRLVNASDPDFRRLVQGALFTGARYGQLARLTVGDFDAEVGSLGVWTRKGDGSLKQYHVQLTEEGKKFFILQCAGRSNADRIFSKDNGEGWDKSHQARPMLEACKRAHIDPPIGINQLRHTYASLSIKNGVELIYIAKNFGHSDTRMVQKHYGHLYESDFVRAIRGAAPRFGFKQNKSDLARLR